MIEGDQSFRPKPGLLDALSIEERRLLFLYFPVLLLVCSLASIISNYYFPGSATLFDVTLATGSNLMAYMWCRIDSDERGYKLHRLFTYAIIIFGVLALLYYIFRSRGFGRGVGAVVALIIYVACTYIAVSIVALVILLVLMAAGLIPPSVLD